jgi:putative ABC transport system permease protein
MWRLLPRLAMRNMLRNRRRTVLTLLAIIAGMVCVIVFGGFISYTYWGLREMTIHSQLGHLQVYKAGYSRHAVSDPAGFYLTDFPGVEGEIHKTPGIRTVTAQLTFSSLISKGDRTLNCLATGVIPEREGNESNAETIVAGQNLQDSTRAGVVLGRDLSWALGATVGDTVTLMTTTTTGMLNAYDVEVLGIARIGAAELDRVFVKLPLSVAQRLLNTTSVEKVVVFLTRTEDTTTVAADLRRRFAASGMSLEVKTWDQLADFYRAVVRMYGGIFGVMQGIIALLFLFCIANTLTMTVFERVREVGTLRAIGTRKSGILCLFLCEALLLGTLGGILGMGGGILAAKLINVAGGFYIPPPPGLTLGYQAYIFIEPGVMFSAFAATVLVALIASLYPAWKAANLKIVEALGHV